MTARLAQTLTPQMSQMKNNSNDRKTQCVYFLWQVLFTTRTFVTWFLKQINEVKITKFSRQSLWWNCFTSIFVWRHRSQYWRVKYIFLGWNVFVPLYTCRSKDQISIEHSRCMCGSFQTKSSCRARLRLLCWNWLCRSQKQWSCWAEGLAKLNLPFALHSFQGLTPFVWIAGFFRRHGTSMRKIFQIYLRYFRADFFFLWLDDIQRKL